MSLSTTDRPSVPAVVHHRLEEMHGGWFVGDFSPSVLHCSGAEVAVKVIPAGGSEPSHEHRLATEVTVVVSGAVEIAGREWRAGDIVVLPPHTPSAFEALTDTVLVVVKSPSLVGDKHLTEPIPVTVIDGDARRRGGRTSPASTAGAIEAELVVVND